MHAMPVMVVILCILAIAYRYYSAFIAAKVATLDDLRETAAVRLNDGQNYHRLGSGRTTTRRERPPRETLRPLERLPGQELAPHDPAGSGARP